MVCTHAHAPTQGVTLVIRLNKKYYNQKRFINAGIDHLDLYYMDGSTPPKHILEKFIQACENAKGAPHTRTHTHARTRTRTRIRTYTHTHARTARTHILELPVYPPTHPHTGAQCGMHMHAMIAVPVF